MRRTVVASLPLLLPALVGLAGCAGEEDAVPQESPAPAPSPRGQGGGDAPAPADTPACAEVRAGIDAFNEGEYDETVSRFEAAVPLAEEQLDGSAAADQLLEAVRWYADLPAEDYPEASLSSPEFQRYKAITLGQCDPVPDGGEPTEPPLEA